MKSFALFPAGALWTSQTQLLLSAHSQFDYLPWTKGARVIKTDANGLIAVDKPFGILSHPNSKSDRVKGLLRLDYDAKEQAYILPDDQDNGHHQQIYLLNRLDSATSGILLLSASLETRDAVLKAFEERRVTKLYRALVFGILDRKGREILWKDRLKVAKFGKAVRAQAGSGKSAETELVFARTIPGSPITSLLELKPLTGRTHQLRVQCAKRRLPIVGDRTYGDFQKNRLYARVTGIKRLCLHSSETKLEYTLGGKVFRFRAVSEPPF